MDDIPIHTSDCTCFGCMEKETTSDTEPPTCVNGSEGALPDPTAALGKNLLPFYGAFLDKLTAPGDPAITDPGVAAGGHYLDTICIAVAGYAIDD